MQHVLKTGKDAACVHVSSERKAALLFVYAFNLQYACQAALNWPGAGCPPQAAELMLISFDISLAKTAW